MSDQGCSAKEKGLVWECKVNSAPRGSPGIVHILVNGARFASKIDPMIERKVMR